MKSGRRKGGGRVAHHDGQVARSTQIDQVSGGGLDFALMARGTKPAAFAREREEVFVFAIIAPDAGEPALQGAAVDEFPQDLFDHRAERAELGFVGVGVVLDKGRLVPLGALPEGRSSRIPSSVRAHAGRRGRRWVLRKMERSVTAEVSRATSPRPRPEPRFRRPTGLTAGWSRGASKAVKSTAQRDGSEWHLVKS